MNHLSTILGAIGPIELVLIVFIFLFILLLPIIALIDILRSNFEQNDKLIWVIIIIFIPILGSILYFLIGTKKKLNN